MSTVTMTLRADDGDLPAVEFDPGIDADALRAVFRRETAPGAIGAAVRAAFRRAVALELHDMSTEIEGLGARAPSRQLAPSAGADRGGLALVRD